MIDGKRRFKARCLMVVIAPRDAVCHGLAQYLAPGLTSRSPSTPRPGPQSQLGIESLEQGEATANVDADVEGAGLPEGVEQRQGAENYSTLVDAEQVGGD